MTGPLRRAVGELVGSAALLPESALEGWPAGPPPPQAIVAPGSEEEVARVLARATAEGWRVLPAGLCTWMEGAGTPEVDLILSTRRLSGMADYEPSDLTFSAGGGIPWSTLSAATRSNGQWLPLDPPGHGRGTLGAAAATGVSGPLKHAYGAPRDHILGLTLVSGDGRILKWGGRVVKNVAGFDVTRLSVGSWGTLGIITSVSARLFPVPEEEVTLLLPGPSAEALLALARDLAGSPLPFAAVELLDPLPPHLSTVRGAGGDGDGDMPVRRGGEAEPGRAAVALRLLGSAAQVAEMEARVVREVGESASESRGRLRLKSAESRAFHETLSEWEGGAALVLRLSLLPSRLERLLEEVRDLLPDLSAATGPGPAGEGAGGHWQGDGSPESRISEGPRLAVHVGWGVLRVAVPAISRGSETRDAVVRRLAGLRERLEAEGGSLTVSRGPADLMKVVKPWGTPGPEQSLMRGLKAEFDPSGILAPGRLGI